VYILLNNRIKQKFKFDLSTYYNNMSQNVKGNENIQNTQQQQQSSSQWAQIIGQVMEKLSGTNMSTTIRFDTLEVDVPRAQGPGGRELGGAKWVINGEIVWTTEVHKATGGG
jgi:hypothetical protein